MCQFNPRRLSKIQDSIEELKKRLRKEDSLLDIGCGHGYLYTAIKHENYLGMDLFQENIDEARKLYQEVEFKCQDLFSLEGVWDIVWCSRVLIHNPDFEGAVAKLRSCARREVILVLHVGPEGSCRAERTEDSGTIYYRVFSEEQIKKQGPAEIIRHQNSPYSTVIYPGNA